MKKSIYYYAAFLLSMAVCSSSLSAVKFSYGIDEWASHLNDEQKVSLQQRIDSELVSTASSAAFQKTTGKNYEFGFNFPRVYLPLKKCLEEIALRSSSQKTPYYADFGGGDGKAFTKMMIASQKPNVFVLELQKGLADLILQTFTPYKELVPGAEYKDIVPNVYVGNVIDFKNDFYKALPTLSGSYVGNLLHFLKPDEITSFLGELYKRTEDGGFVSAMTTAPSGCKAVVEAWDKQRSQAAPFPGYMMVDSYVKRNSFATRNTGVFPCKAFSLHEEKKEINLGEEKDWFYNNNKSGQAPWERDPHGDEDDFQRPVHRAFHYLDPATLKTAFSNAGFSVEEAYLFNAQQVKIKPEDMPLELLEKGEYTTGIFARKISQTEADHQVTIKLSKTEE